MISYLMRFVAVVLVLLAGLNEQANAGTFNTGWKEIKEILLQDNAFGGCSVRPEGYSGTGSCKTNYVSLDCNGDFISKEAARRHYEAVQLAIALDKKVLLFVNDKQKHNGYCVAFRVRVLND